MDEPWRIELMGWLRATRGDQVVSRFRSRQTGALLAYLAYHSHRSHPREVLIELLWPEVDLEAGRNGLRVALTSLRHQLEPPGVPAGAVIVADRSSVRLNPDACSTDVAAFETALRASTGTTSPRERALQLAEAAELYRGELLPGYFDEWIFPERQRLAETYLQALTQLITLIEEGGEPRRALPWARRAVAADPLREEAHRDLIRLLAASGQTDAALQQYAELERLLEPLGEAPGPEIRALMLALEPKAPEGSERIGDHCPTLPEPNHSLPPPSDSVLRPPLPRGTVTLLLAEVVGAIPPDERSDAFPADLSDHCAVLRQVIGRHGGCEVKPGTAAASAEESGSFVVAFQGAGAALATAIAGQRALAGERDEERGMRDEKHHTLIPHPSSLIPEPRVRMALHTGDADPRGDDDYGSLLQAAERVLLAAHGGQILCSESTAALLCRDLEEGVRLADLGAYRLRDKSPPERLFQVDYPAMEQRDFPPLKAQAGHAGNLPVQLTRFFGREAEMVRLRALLASSHPSSLIPHPSRLIALTGPGGVGKTRLALAVAEQMRERFQGSIWFAPLAGLTDPRLLSDKVREALRLPRVPGVEPLEQAITFLTRQPSLLLLDNLEHLVTEGASLVQTLLEQVETLTILVTSRHRLDVAGEQEFPVAPLPAPVDGSWLMVDGPTKAGRPDPSTINHQLSTLVACESVRLFVDRAQAVRPDFQVTPANAAAVAALCARLEGLPLALELAAARARMLTPAQMLARLEQRFELLVRPGREEKGVAARHHSLRAALDWSYQSLPPEQQQLFARLSVFRGGWTLEAAEAVCGEGCWVLDCLTELQECSLVLAEVDEAEMRYRVLETVREYAAEQLPAGERAELAHRHASYLLGLVEQAEPELLGPRQSVWLQRLEREHDNLRAALAWAAGSGELDLGLRLGGALWGFWWARGYLSEGRERLADLLALPGAAARTAARARALACAGILAHYQGDSESSRLAYEESLDICRERGDRWGIAFSLTGLGFVAQQRSDYAAARALQAEGLPLWRELGNQAGVAWSLNNLGDVARDQGDDAAAWTFYEESLAIRRGLGDGWGVAFSLMGLGDMALERGDLEAAQARFEEGLAIRRELGDRIGIAWALHHLGDLAMKRGDLGEARSLYEECLALQGELGAKGGIAAALSGLAHVTLRQGDPEEARSFFQKSLVLRRELGDRDGVSACLEGLARVAQPTKRSG